MAFDFWRPKSVRPATVAGVVFSKDRALQLHALISSYSALVANAAPLHVLYASSSAAHAAAYRELCSTSPAGGTIRSFTEETAFRAQLLDLLGTIRADAVFFLTDDDVFIEQVDLQTFLAFDLRKFVPTLRLGLNLQWCYPQNCAQPLPPFRPAKTQHVELLYWRWKNGEVDWRYPLSVNGHLFGREELLRLARQLEFRAPNSFEEALQKFLPRFLRRHGVCFRKAPLLNIPCNKVQVENTNIHGACHQDYLLQQWQKGLQIDTRKLRGYPNISAHQEVDLAFVSRTNDGQIALESSSN